MKLVINRCPGGWSVSHKALKRYAELKQLDYATLFRKSDRTYERYRTDNPSLLYCTFDRHDPLLVQVVEELGDEANGFATDLKVVDIPDDVEYIIVIQNGVETVFDKNRMWT